MLNLRISQRWTEQRRLALLPPALRRLLEHAIAHRDTSDPSVLISVVGDLNKARGEEAPHPCSPPHHPLSVPPRCTG